MSIKVLLADGNAVMRPVIARVLEEEPAVELVGEATTFGETLQMTAALKPDVLLLELHFDDEREYPAEVVKAQVLLHAKCVLAISLWNDAEAKPWCSHPSRQSQTLFGTYSRDKAILSEGDLHENYKMLDERI